MKSQKLCPTGSKIQTILFDKDKFTEKEAKKWADNNDFKYGKVDETENKYRLRQEKPAEFKNKTFRTIELTDGVKAVIACPIEKKSMKKPKGHNSNLFNKGGVLNTNKNWDNFNDGGQITIEEEQELNELMEFKKGLRGQEALDWLNRVHPKYARFNELLEKYMRNIKFDNGGQITHDRYDFRRPKFESPVNELWIDKYEYIPTKLDVYNHLQQIKSRYKEGSEYANFTPVVAVVYPYRYGWTKGYKINYSTSAENIDRGFYDEIAGKRKIFYFDEKGKIKMNEGGSVYSLYHETLSSALEEANKYANSKGYEVNGSYFPDITVGGVGYGETKRTSVELSKDGKPQKKQLNIQVYRMDNGKYELNTYIFNDGGSVDVKTIEYYKLDDLIIKSYKDTCTGKDGYEDVTKYSLETKDGFYKSFADCSGYSYWGNTELTPNDKMVYPHSGYNYMFVNKDIFNNKENKLKYVKLLNELISGTNYRGYKNGGGINNYTEAEKWWGNDLSLNEQKEYAKKHLQSFEYDELLGSTSQYSKRDRRQKFINEIWEKEGSPKSILKGLYSKGGNVDYSFEYQMLSRLQMDNDAYLNGVRGENHLWAGNVDAQIEEMKRLWNMLPEKPQWLSMEDILDYEKKMKEKYSNGGSVNEDKTKVAKEIINQIGGMGRLNMMVGAYNFIALDNGVSFRIKNQRANYIKITVTSMDLYDLEVGRIRGDKYTIVVKKEGLYDNMLKPAIEEATSMYLSFDDGGLIESLTTKKEQIIKEIDYLTERKDDLENNRIKPHKIIGRGIKPQYARKLAFEWLDNRLMEEKNKLSLKNQQIIDVSEGKNIVLYEINGKKVISEKNIDSEYPQVEYINGNTEAFSKERLNQLKDEYFKSKKESAKVNVMPDNNGDEIYTNFFNSKVMESFFGDEIKSFWEKHKDKWSDEDVAKLRAEGFNDKDIFTMMFGYLSTNELKCDKEFGLNGILKMSQQYRESEINEIIESKKSGYYVAGLKTPISSKELIVDVFSKYKINQEPLVFDNEGGQSIGDEKIYIYKGDGVYIGLYVNAGYGENKPYDIESVISNRKYLGLVTDSTEKLYDVINVLFNDEQSYLKDLNLFYNGLGGIDANDIISAFGVSKKTDKIIVEEVKSTEPEIIVEEKAVENPVVESIQDKINSIKEAIEYLKSEADNGDEESKEALEYLKSELKEIGYQSFADLNNPNNIKGFIHRPTGNMISPNIYQDFNINYDDSNKISSIELWGQEKGDMYLIRKWERNQIDSIFVGNNEESITEFNEGGDVSVGGKADSSIDNIPSQGNVVEVLIGGKADYMSLDDIADMHGVSLDHILRQARIGEVVEREHTHDYRKIIEIVKDHLYESPDYYTKLQQIESTFGNGGEVGNNIFWIDVPAEHNNLFYLKSLSQIGGVVSGVLQDNGSYRYTYNSERDLDRAIAILNILKNPDFGRDMPQNLSQLKKYLTVGKLLRVSYNRNRPDWVGNIKVVAKVQTNGIYFAEGTQVPADAETNIKGLTWFEFPKVNFIEFSPFGFTIYVPNRNNADNQIKLLQYEYVVGQQEEIIKSSEKDETLLYNESLRFREFVDSVYDLSNKIQFDNGGNITPCMFNNGIEFNLDKESVSCFINAKNTGRTLLLKRAGGDYEGTWSLISGGVEGSESSDETIKREIKEELGVDLNFDNLIFMTATKHPDRTHYYYELTVNEEFEPILNNENSDYMWANVYDFTVNMHPLLIKFMKNEVFI